MPMYQIKNFWADTIIGNYEAEDEDFALDIMAREAGFENYDDCLSFERSTGLDNLLAVWKVKNSTQS
jgi:hypothetical protein